MILLYCDETNLEERNGDFLIYGGLGIPADRALGLSRSVDDLRKEYKLDPTFRLKFNPGPKHLDHQEFIALKQRVMEAAVAHGALLVAYLILHDIAKSPDEGRRNGINVVCYHFDCLLRRSERHGLVLIDRFNDAGNLIEAHLTEKFSIGLVGMPYSSQMRLGNIIGLHYSAIGQSHFPSIVDIVLGSLRFAINAHTRRKQEHHVTAGALLKLLAPMCWRDKDNGPVSELSVAFSPKVVKADHYRAAYQGLKDFLAANGIETEQRIEAIRTY